MSYKIKSVLQNPKYAVILTLILFFVLLAGAVVGDDDDGRNFYKKGVQPVTNELYTEECGSCHFAYPPGLLPRRSWEKMMSNLENHFNDNAELEPQVESSIRKYLTRNAADNSRYRRSRKIIRSLRDSETPTRITQVAYFKHEHDEVPNRMVKENKQVMSFSHCDKCHQNAAMGSFSERDINIPGFGHWDD